MISAILTLGLLLTAVPATYAGSRATNGAWTASVSDTRQDQLDLSLRIGTSMTHGHTYERSTFAGLTAEQVRASTQAPVHFELRREAGTIAFDGTFRDGQGAGQFTFAPNREFPALLRSQGVAFTTKNGDVDRELFELTLFDVSIAFIRSMQMVGYRVTLDEYVQFRIFDVDPGYVREMALTGFDHLSADKLVETRIHGATPEYIRRMREAGDDLTLDGYIQSRIFDVTPEFGAEMKRLGYGGADHDMLVQFKIHGVTPEFIRELRKLGYSGLPAEKLVEMRIHDVSPEFIRRVEKAGYRKVPVDKLVQMRIFSIEPEMVKALDDAAN